MHTFLTRSSPSMPGKPRQTEGIPVVINQGRTPPLLCCVVDIDCMSSTYPLPLLAASIHLGSPRPSPLGILLELSAFVRCISPCPGSSIQLKRTLVVNLFDISQLVREALPAPHTEVCHNVLHEAVSIFLLVRQRLQRLNQMSSQALRYRMRFEDLGRLILSPVCTTKSLFGCYQSHFSPQIAHHQLSRPFLPETHQVGHCNASLSSGWRNEASQVVCASDHDLLHNAQPFLPHPVLPARTLPLFCQGPIPWLSLQP